MKQFIFSLLRFVITLGFVALAVVIGWRLYASYELAPWTRDGRVRADLSQIAPDVSGLIESVPVHDNQPVAAGQVLFVIDQARYKLALTFAQDAVKAEQIALDEAQREDRRNHGLGDLVSAEVREQGASKVSSLQAAMASAQDAVAVAQLNLDRTVVKAPLAGVTASVDLRPGDYAVAGKPVLAMVVAQSIYVDGYFEETKLPRIHLGDPAEIRLMGESQPLRGHVTSISPGIADRERIASATLLPDVNPTFSWVRLAQRVPVRVAIDRVPPGVQLIAGRTATVTIEGHYSLPGWRAFIAEFWAPKP